MNKLRHLLRPHAVVLLLSASLALSAPLYLLSQDNKENPPPPKAPTAVSAQKGGATCGKTATEAQVSGIAAKLRQFQAKQQAKANKNQPKAEEQATNRKP